MLVKTSTGFLPDEIPCPIKAVRFSGSEKNDKH